MNEAPQLSKLETLITKDPKYLFTIASYVLILTIHINSITFQFAFLGLVTFILYFLINGIFLGCTLFWKETAFFRLLFGILLLIMLLGFLGWLSVIIYSLDASIFTLVLIVTTSSSSILNKKVKNKDAA